MRTPHRYVEPCGGGRADTSARTTVHAWTTGGGHRQNRSGKRVRGHEPACCLRAETSQEPKISKHRSSQAVVLGIQIGIQSELFHCLSRQEMCLMRARSGPSHTPRAVSCLTLSCPSPSASASRRPTAAAAGRSLPPGWRCMGMPPVARSGAWVTLSPVVSVLGTPVDASVHASEPLLAAAEY